MGHFLKTQAYIDLESPINVMSKQHYNMIMSKGLESRQKPSNLSKKRKFVGRVKGLKFFIGNFTYQCNFMILKDTTSIIDHHLGEVVFGKPFARNIGLVYDQEEGMVTFEKDCEEITFKMPHKMELSNHIDFKNINTDSIPPFVLGSNDAHGKTYYSDSLTLGFEYKGDESISKEIRHLMILEIEAKRHKGEVTLYLMRRRLEVLRKFHWMILGGRFNQLSHVAFDLLRDALSAIFGLSELKEVNRHKVPGMHWIARLKIYVHQILGNVLSSFVIFNNEQVKLYAFVLITRPGPLFRCDPIWGCYRLVSRAKVIENQVKCFCWTITVLATTTTTTTPVTNAQLKALIDQGVTDALAARDADRSRNGNDSHNSGTGSRRTELTTYECTYTDFLKCQPLNFKGTEGVVGISQWFERMEFVFHISNCAVENQVMFATCTLYSVALTW
ncbi:protein kinase-like domain, concanavalin A-like lectin/glucanase domain protein [Tanacetum coccineum]